MSEGGPEGRSAERGRGDSAQRTERIACALALLVACSSLFWLVQSAYDARSDAALYLSTARSLARLQGYTYLGEPFVLRPPGFPLLIAPTIAWAGMDFRAIHWTVSLWGLLSLVLLYRFARPQLGWPLSLAMVLVVWVNPAFQRLCNSAMSDVPGAALLLGALLLERRALRTADARLDLAVGVAVAAAFYVRPMNALLLPAIVVGRGAHAWLGGLNAQQTRALARRSLGLLVLAGLLIAPWSLWSSLERPDPPADQTKLYSFGTAMLRADPGDPTSRALGLGELAARVPIRTRQLVGVLGMHLAETIKGRRDDPFADEDDERKGSGRASVPDGSTLSEVLDLALPVAMGIALLAGLSFAAWRRPDASHWYVLGAIATLLVYYGFQDRLVLPIYLIALPALIECTRDLAGYWLRSQAAGTGAASLVLATALVVPFGSGEHAAIEQRDRELAELSAALRRELRPDDTLGAGRGFHLGVLLDRPVYSLGHIVQRDPQSGLQRAIDRYGIDVIVLDPRGGSGAKIARKLREQVGPPRHVASARMWRIPRVGDEPDTR